MAIPCDPTETVAFACAWMAHRKQNEAERWPRWRQGSLSSPALAPAPNSAAPTSFPSIAWISAGARMCAFADLQHFGRRRMTADPTTVAASSPARACMRDGPDARVSLLLPGRVRSRARTPRAGRRARIEGGSGGNAGCCPLRHGRRVRRRDLRLGLLVAAVARPGLAGVAQLRRLAAAGVQRVRQVSSRHRILGTLCGESERASGTALISRPASTGSSPCGG